MEIKGIDVSVFQGEIDWDRVKASGVDFVMVRIGWSAYAGGLNQDQNFVKNVQGALAAGLHVGGYLYSYDQTPEAARKSAQSVIDAVRFYPLDYPIAFDLEDQRNLAFGRELNTQIASAFLNEIERNGYYAMLYTYTSFAENNLNMQNLEQFSLWIADYRGQVGYKGPYGMWQYVGNDGRCEGVNGPCDRDIAYQDYAAIIRNAGLNGFDKTENECSKQLQQIKQELAQEKEMTATLTSQLQSANIQIITLENKLQSVKNSLQSLAESI